MSDNTWPNGRRQALDQSEHEHWNANNHPGTRQLCHHCDQPTGRCEEDSMWDSDGNPCCEKCHEEKSDTEGPVIHPGELKEFGKWDLG